MLCGNGTNHFFKRCRSLRNLRSELPQSEHSLRKRRPSASSTISTSSFESSSRPSTSTTDWDPLRLNPPSNASRGHVKQPSHDQRRPATAHGHEWNMSHSASEKFHSMMQSRHRATEIYGGFDFGFEKKQEPNDYFSSQKEMQMCSVFSSPTPSSGSEFDFDPVPSTHDDAVTPRPRPDEFDEADFFIRKGGWKRRGIVFVSEQQQVTEDDCFDLP